MSSISLDSIRRQFPAERAAVDRLEELVNSGAGGHFSLDQLADEIGARSRTTLALILGELAVRGVVKLELQVKSPRTNIPLKTFSRISDIPSRMRDETTDTDFDVSTENVSPIYEVASGGR